MGTRATSGLVAVIVILVSLPAAAQTGMVRQRIEAETFFLDDPKWVFGMRTALGYELGGEMFPDLGLHFGRHFGNHVYLGLYADARLSAPQHVQADLRWGARFGRRRFSFATGTGVGVLGVFEPREAGPYVSWWLDFRYRLRGSHSLLVFAQVDLLFEQLGFSSTRQFFKVGVGWEISF